MEKFNQRREDARKRQVLPIIPLSSAKSIAEINAEDAVNPPVPRSSDAISQVFAATHADIASRILPEEKPWRPADRSGS